MTYTNQIKGRIVDVLRQTIYPGIIFTDGSKIQAIQEIENEDDRDLPFILPGFIDAHIHIESSMLVPSQFARLAVVHGTVATISDPHEIANVCGMEGVEYMINDGKKVPFHFFFGAPSCVPATVFETAGAELNADDVEKLLRKDEVKYLSEMMDFPGVLRRDAGVMKKIAAAQTLNKPVDGHAPGLRGGQAKQYIDAGISTDHECFTKAEALDKLQYGMHILVREGSAAKNFEALIDLLHDYPEKIMFCSDDKHPDSLVEGHINQLCARAASKGIDIYKILRAACINPVLHYRLDVGLLRAGDSADFILVKDLTSFEVLQTWVKGEWVADKGKSLVQPVANSGAINNFHCKKKTIQDFSFVETHALLPVIEALDGQLITNKLLYEHPVSVSDTGNDILKIVVVNRYTNAPVAKAFIKNFGLKKGAIASSVAHDSHNIVAVGTDDTAICHAVNMVIECKGGVSLWAPSPGSGEPINLILPLPVAGLMSTEDGYSVAARYAMMDKAAKALGSALSAPYMTLSFMALLVIPHLKLSDRGLFDGDTFRLM
ncbi:adenine deaminase [Agriterribacter sp.]|uniref:adenine deaminase n=1 Tax=Agriterribacter sp. TaxID=2821509 RepID=UPI002B848598|nr:adenine deaminase [Agriterribacter sp.]HTN08148.1 adenine deaminase [Agriterribacter sp.]